MIFLPIPVNLYRHTMSSSDILNYSLTFLSLLVAALAWLAKLRWSKEFKEAKQAQLDTLTEKVGLYESIISNKLIEHSKLTISELESLLQEVEEQKEELASKALSDLEEKEKILNEYVEKQRTSVYFHTHNLRAPVASSLGLISLMDSPDMSDKEREQILFHLKDSLRRIDEVVHGYLKEAVEQDNRSRRR